MGFLREFFAPFFEPVNIAPLAAAEVQETKRKTRTRTTKAGHYLNPRSRGQVAIIIRALRRGDPLTTGQLKYRLEQAGHIVNDIGHRISEARWALDRSGVVLIGNSIKLRSGKRCHQYHIAYGGLTRLEELEAGL